MKVKSANGPIQCIAAKAIILHKNKALVLKQSAEAAVDGANRYHPPGGIVEPGEHLVAALVREVKEETSLIVQIDYVLAVEEWRVNIRGEDCQFFGVFYACTPLEDTKVTLQAEEASHYAWIGLDDLDRYDILEPSLRVLKKALSAHN